MLEPTATLPQSERVAPSQFEARSTRYVQRPETLMERGMAAASLRSKNGKHHQNMAFFFRKIHRNVDSCRDYTNCPAHSFSFDAFVSNGFSRQCKGIGPWLFFVAITPVVDPFAAQSIHEIRQASIDKCGKAANAVIGVKHHDTIALSSCWHSGRPLRAAASAWPPPHAGVPHARCAIGIGFDACDSQVQTLWHEGPEGRAKSDEPGG